MNVLVACEFSGVVRDWFRSLHHNAYSCDLHPSPTKSEFHIQHNVLDLLTDDWDLLIAHPPCTYLSNSSVHLLHSEPGRYNKMVAGANFFCEFLNAPIPRICIENPIMHGYAKQIIQQPYAQLIQPHEFGHGETKATCLWLKNLPPLRPCWNTLRDGREQRILNMPKSKNRGRLRSITYDGIARAMAQQWGCLTDDQQF